MSAPSSASGPAPATIDGALAELARLRRIEAAALAYTRLHEQQRAAMLPSAAASNASPTAGAPSRRAMLDAERAVREAVRS